MAKGATLRPRRVKSKEDRNAGRGGFITLKKTGEQFIGYALFTPDPELDDNPGYYEYFEHYTPATGYMPCAGDDCPLCDEGDNPSTRAKTLWLVDDELKVFTLNYYMIEDFGDMHGEGDPILGQQFRVKRLAGNGKYAIRPKTEKLTKTELKKALKDVDEDYLEKLAIKQMRRVLEEMDVSEAMESDDDDDDDDEDEKSEKGKGKGKSSKSTSKKGKPAVEDDDDEAEDESFDPEEDDEAEGLTVIVVKAKKKDNILTVQGVDGDDTTTEEFDIYGTDEVDLTDRKKGEVFVVSFEKDEDGDFVVSEVGEAEEESEDDDDGSDDDSAVSSVENEVVTITAVNTEDETLTVEMEDGTEFDLYFLGEGEDDNGRDWSELDFDDYSEGQKVTITAAKDEDGDMLASVFPEPEKSKGKSKGGKVKGKSKTKSKK